MFGRKKEIKEAITMNPTFEQDQDLEGDIINNAFGVSQMPQVPVQNVQQVPQVQYQPVMPVQTMQQVQPMPIQQMQPVQRVQNIQPRANSKIIKTEIGEKYYYLIESNELFSLGDCYLAQ